MVFIPVGQKRLTNVAQVRLKLGKETFEIACYRNKVLAWKLGQERNIAEVLQSEDIFINLGRGEVANNQTLQSAFGANDGIVLSNLDMCEVILEKGVMQVTDDERGVLNKEKLNEIVRLVDERTMNPKTNSHHGRDVIHDLLDREGFQVSLDRPSKPQAVEATRLLMDRIDGAVLCRAWFELQLKAEDFGKLVERTSTFRALHQNTLHFLPQTDTINVAIDPSIYGAFLKFMRRDLSGFEEVIVSRSVSSSRYLQGDSPNTDKELFTEEKPLFDPTVVPYSAVPKSTVTEVKCGPCFKADPRESVFRDAKGFRDHMKTDWHLFNVKRESQGTEPVTRELYNELDLDMEIVSAMSGGGATKQGGGKNKKKNKGKQH